MSDQSHSAVERVPAELLGPRDEFAATPRGATGPATRRLARVPNLRRRALMHSRPLVGFLLVAAALVWAVARGLTFYGVSPVHLVYDLDQPPWLLLLVSGWLFYRSRSRSRSRP